MTQTDPFDQLSDASARLATLIRSVPPDSLGNPAATAGWTVDETIRHVHGEYRSVADQEPPELDLELESIADELPELVDAIRDRFVPLVADLGESVFGAPAYVVGETIVHGDQIACAAGDTVWHPTHGDVMLLWSHGVPLLQGLLSPDVGELRESWEVRSSTGEGVLSFTIDNGTVSIGNDEAIDPANRYLVTVDDAAAWVLEFPAQRRPPSDAATALLVSRFTKP